MKRTSMRARLTPFGLAMVIHFPSLFGFEVAAKLLRRLGPVRILERESRLEEARRDYPAALQNELRLGSHEERSQLEHPLRRREADRGSPGPAQDGHELTVGKRVWRRHVDGTVEVALDQEIDGTGEVISMDPGDVLTAVAGRSAEPAADQRQQGIENASRVRIHDHRGAQLHLPRLACRSI